ncbi:protein moonraker-like isoform X2 [Denticeps clupeoides]|uniref:protein moonraker-like isoform X2 n=1 Tax=Denticeps clupeoides TaxID=299321 RepID=UPI0010A58CB0|nr:protein moonraker-like isoform X2 [Denticeps clupeoides]XP_028856571.1 protein moonraker-like isoform X2 [Denticeps clupeoides]
MTGTLQARPSVSLVGSSQPKPPPSPAGSGAGASRTRLLFNEAMPASASNRATNVAPPAPIVIEKLRPQAQEQSGVWSRSSSSLRFSVLSEERLQVAVRLAKRDLHRKRQESITRTPFKHEGSPQKNISTDLDQRPDPKTQQNVQTKRLVTESGAEVLVYTPQKHPKPSRPKFGQSPPTRDPGPKPSCRLSQEVCRLQMELATYVHRVETLGQRKRFEEEPLEPDEQRRMEVRRQEQATRSARIIYVLQQQVRDIQEELEELHSHNVKRTKKTRAMDRLAAAHRGAVRAVQVFAKQLSDPEGRVPAHYKDLGQLIRQLSLCSAKVEVGQGSAVPEAILDILQKLENLDSALRKQESLKKREGRVSSPVRQKSPGQRSHGIPHGWPSKAQAPRKAAAAAHHKKPSGPPWSRRPTSHQLSRWGNTSPERAALLRARLQGVLRMGEQSGQSGSKPTVRTAEHIPDKSKCMQARETGFQQSTVSSRLRESQMQQKEPTVPWIPTSPHSPPLQRPISKRPEPRCLFSPLKNVPDPAEQQAKARPVSDREPAYNQRHQAHKEALRQAWLDKVTTKHLRELSQLSNEETERIQRLRSEVGLPTQWAEKAEQAARERIQPLLDQAETMASADLLSEAALEDLLPDRSEADGQPLRHLQATTLESMLLRMEEMEKDQELVRRRFAHISYSDPLYWEKAKDRGLQKAVVETPGSPKPIRLTKPAVRQTGTADIVLQSPVETGVPSETSEDASPSRQHRFSGGAESSGKVRLTLPVSTARSIRKYRDVHDSYLRLVSHEAVGRFDPWSIAESLAEELMTEALADVAAEFQDVCEEYTGAVFTTEFMQPVQSPSQSVS